MTAIRYERQGLTSFRVMGICVAYESGFGHGCKDDGYDNHYTEGTPEYEAYAFGYAEAKKRMRDIASAAGMSVEQAKADGIL